MCFGTAPGGVAELFLSPLLRLPRVFFPTRLGGVTRFVSTSRIKKVGVFGTILLREAAVFSPAVLSGLGSNILLVAMVSLSFPVGLGLVVRGAPTGDGVCILPVSLA